MCTVLEFERDKDRMATDGPEARALRIALEVLQDRKNRIGGEWNIRIPCLPLFFEKLITAHVIHLLGTFCLSEGIDHTRQLEVHTHQCRKLNLKAEINLLRCRLISRAMDHGFFTASGSFAYSSYFPAVILMGIDGIQPCPE
jgi:hypothetical protein